MLPLVHPRRWQLASLLLLLAVMAFALVPSYWPRHVGNIWDISDKILHCVTFAILAIWFSGQYERSSYWKLVTGLLIFGALIEACQYMVPYRTAELGDMVADIVGILCGFLIASLGVGGWSMQIEQWLQKR